MTEPRAPYDDAIWNVRPHGMTPKDYARRRDLVLLTGDWRELKKFARWMGNVTLASDEAIEISFHQLRTAVTSLPRDIRLVSVQWLTDRGYRTWDDGDLVTSG